MTGDIIVTRWIFLIVPWLLVTTVAATPAEPLSDIPKLKPAVTVVSEFVRIGDLVENAGVAADVAIFRSPDVGSTGSVSAAKVLDIIGQHNLLIVDASGINQIEITRDSRVISTRDLEKRIARAFSGQYGLGDPNKLSVVFDREPRPLYVETSATGDLQVARAAYETRTSRFDVTLTLPGSAVTRSAPLRYTGSIMDAAEVAVLTRPYNRGEVVKEADVSIERRPKADVSADAALGLENVVGFAARQSLRTGIPLRRSDLVRPEIIKRDETVTLIYEVPGILLTVRGKAVEGGANGDVINVLNIQSKRTVQGVISGPGRVTIASTANIPVSIVNTAAVAPDSLPDQGE
jgi:flagella basal body P-ring formation protein FlgA